MKKKYAGRIFIGVGLIAVVVGGAVLWNANSRTPEIPAATDSSQTKPVTESIGPESSEIEVRRFHDAIAGQDLETMVVGSTLIVRGKVTGKSAPFQVQSVDDSKSVFTYYTIEPQEILRGTPDDPNQIQVRTEGGVAGDLDVLTDSSPKMEEGKECIFILFQYGMGGGFTTGDDYYEVVGLSQGVLTQTEDQTKYCSVNGEEGTYDELKALIEELNTTSPVDENYYREDFYRTQQGNLETDFITQEEYERVLGDVDKYAVILPETRAGNGTVEERHSVE